VSAGPFASIGIDTSAAFFAEVFAEFVFGDVLVSAAVHERRDDVITSSERRMPIFTILNLLKTVIEKADEFI